MAIAFAVAFLHSGAAAQTPRPATNPCAATFTAAQFRRTVDRIYHQHGHVLPRQKARLLHIRACAVTPAANRSMRRMFVRQRHARQHRIELARMRCGSPACNRRLGRHMVIRRYGVAGWNCAYPIIDQESHWDATIHNGGGHGYVPGLSYGIPQALPGSKMASAGPRWMTDPRTQIRWMLSYFQGTYGGPCGALAHKQATGWY